MDYPAGIYLFKVSNRNIGNFSVLFDGIVDGLNMKRCEISKEHCDPTLNTIKTFEKHPSILKIKEPNSGCRFPFENEIFQKSNSRAGCYEYFTTSRYFN